LPNNQQPSASTAGTSNSYQFVRKWASDGSGVGQFSSPYGVAIDSSSGNVYVAETYNHRIQKFDSNGNFITKGGSQGAGDGEFDSPSGIAVDSKNRQCMCD
jgi:tripartite motif-containing protein 71